MKSFNFLTSYLGEPHGTAKSAKDFLIAALANKVNVEVFSPNRAEIEKHRYKFDLAKPRWNPIKKPTNHWNLRNLTSPRSFLSSLESFVRSSRRRLVSRRPLIVNGWASLMDYEAVKDQFKSKHILIVRESLRHFSFKDRETHDIISRVSHFDHFIFVSNNVRQAWEESNLINSKRNYTLFNCCDEEEAQSVTIDRASLRDKLSIDNDSLLFLCPGSIEERKGQDLLLLIIDKVQREIPNSTVIFLGDPTTKWGEEIVQQINRLAPAFNYRLRHVPAQTNIWKYLLASDVLVFPSRAEAFPRTILEAMFIGVPVVASKVDGVPEQISDSIDGFLFDANDHQSMLTSLVKIGNSPSLRMEIAKNAKEKYSRLFARKNQIANLKEILTDILA